MLKTIILFFNERGPFFTGAEVSSGKLQGIFLYFTSQDCIICSRIRLNQGNELAKSLGFSDEECTSEGKAQSIMTTLLSGGNAVTRSRMASCCPNTLEWSV